MNSVTSVNRKSTPHDQLAGLSPSQQLLSFFMNSLRRFKNSGRILGRNPGTSPKTFPPCYSKPPVQLWIEFFLFFQTRTTSFSFFSALMYTVKEKGGKPERTQLPLPYGLRNPYRNLKSGELSRLCPETSKKLYVHEFGFRLLHAIK